MNKTFCFDLDGTLTLESEGFGYLVYQYRTPKEEMVNIVNKLKEEGNMIILYTSRFEEDREVTEEWLKKYDVKYDQLIFGKLQYDYWIDDKAINEQVFRELKREANLVGERVLNKRI